MTTESAQSGRAIGGVAFALQRAALSRRGRCQRRQSAAFDPEASFAKGHASAVRQIEQPFPFDAEEFEAELRSHDRPSWDTPEARRERDAREAAEEKRLYGEPRPKEY